MFLSNDGTEQIQVPQGRGPTVDEPHVKVRWLIFGEPVQLFMFLYNDCTVSQVSQGRRPPVYGPHATVDSKTGIFVISDSV